MKFKKAVLIEIEDFAFDEATWKKLDDLIEQRVSLNRDDPDLLNQLKDCDCLLLGFQIPVDKKMIDAMPNLKYIGVLATAYGTIDFKHAATKGIPVCNLAGYSSEAVAEFTIAAILYDIRQIDEGRKRALQGNYGFDGMKAKELRGSNFGVIGLGSIGKRVAELAAGFGANVSYWSRNKKDAPFEYKELGDLLSSSDFISVNIAQAPETEKLLNADNIPSIKAGTVLISTVPPEVIDTDALADRLKKGDIDFIGDHPDEMPAEELSKLTPYKNAILFPPIAFITDEARQTKQEMFVGNIKAALEGNPQNAVK